VVCLEGGTGKAQQEGKGYSRDVTGEGGFAILWY